MPAARRARKAPVPRRKAPPAPHRRTGGALRRITFVTGNAGKAAELRAMLKPLGIAVDQDERGYPEVQADTLREVAEAGARHLLDSGLRPPFLLEDSGLFVAALRGFPGVYSRHALDTVGIPGLLRLLGDVELESRGATFQACLLYVDATGTTHAFEGRCPGRIADAPSGAGGFGFDPVFIPRGHDVTFATMSADQKAALSHRGQAVRAFVQHVGAAAGART